MKTTSASPFPPKRSFGGSFSTNGGYTNGTAGWFLRHFLPKNTKSPLYRCPAGCKPRRMTEWVRSLSGLMLPSSPRGGGLQSYAESKLPRYSYRSILGRAVAYSRNLFMVYSSSSVKSNRSSSRSIKIAAISSNSASSSIASRNSSPSSITDLRITSSPSS